MTLPQAGGELHRGAARRRWPFLLVGGGTLGIILGVLAWGAWARRGSETATAPDSAGVAEQTPSGPSLFRDVTAGSGVDFTYRNGEEADRYSILESLGGGVALFDYDGDGLLDLFVAGGGTFGGPDRKRIEGLPCRLYKNLGAWKFRDVTAEAGLDGIAFYTHGCAVGDYNHDGWPDLLVTGYGRFALYRNERDGRGGRRFVEVTRESGLCQPAASPAGLHWSTSAAWADLMGKGYADLYVCHYVAWSFAPDQDPLCPGHAPGVTRDVCPPEAFNPLPHALYRNNGDGTFTDVTAKTGVRPGAGLGVLAADLNDDGRPDLFVANDGTGNYLYLNRGQGRLEETAAELGVAADELGKTTGSMGVDAGDCDGSGRPSLFVTNFEHQKHELYLNLGGESFKPQSRAAGIAALGQRLVGFGTAFVDVDNDGWEDLVLVNGHVLRHPFAGTPRQRPVLLRNVEYRGRRFFEDWSVRGGPFFQIPALGRGLAVGDLDNDGWPDLVISHTNSPVVLLRNEGGGAGGAHWLGIRLVGRDDRPVAGATVTLEVAGIPRTRFAKSGGSYLSSSDPRLLFGLGAVKRPGRLTVRWPWGATETWEGLEADCYWEVREGRREPRRIKKGMRDEG